MSGYDAWKTTHPDDWEPISFGAQLRAECRISTLQASRIAQCAGCGNVYPKRELELGLCGGCRGC